MLRTLIELQRAMRDYVAGSAYLLAHLATHERRARGLLAVDAGGSPQSTDAKVAPRPGLAKASPRRAPAARAIDRATEHERGTGT